MGLRLPGPAHPACLATGPAPAAVVTSIAIGARRHRTPTRRSNPAMKKAIGHRPTSDPAARVQPDRQSAPAANADGSAGFSARRVYGWVLRSAADARHPDAEHANGATTGRSRPPTDRNV